MPWVINEPASGGVNVVVDPWGTNGQVLQFGPYYNTAQAPISSADQTLSAAMGTHR